MKTIQREKSMWTSYGYESGSSMLNSIMHLNLMKITLPIAMTLGGILVFLGEIAGLGLAPLAGVGLLLVLEWSTGVYLSVSVNNEKFTSSRATRIIFKGFVYFGFLVALNLAQSFEPTWWLQEFGKNIIASIHIGAYIYICICEVFVSIVENMGKIGMFDSAPILLYIKKQLGRFLDVDIKKPLSKKDDGDVTEDGSST